MSKRLPVYSHKSPFTPMTRDECVARGWLPRHGEPTPEHGLDFVLVTGDAYVDHPSFANAVIARVLESRGYRVAILAQPEWRSADPFKVFGPPRVAWLVSAGNLDSMLNNYTAHKRPRSDDQYSPDGAAGRRPDYATVVYSQRCREAHKGVPIIIGGVEASMRRLAHYDYWSDTVRPSILQSSKADLVVHGMGEAPILEIARRLAAGESVRDLRDMRSVAWLAGKKDTTRCPGTRPWCCRASTT